MENELPTLILNRQRLLNHVVENEGVLEAEVELAIRSKDGQISLKIDDCATFMKLAPKEAEILREEARELIEAARVLENRADRLKTYLKDHMLSSQTLKLEGEKWSLNVQGSKDSLKLKDEISTWELPHGLLKAEVDYKKVHEAWPFLEESIRQKFILTKNYALVTRPQKRKIDGNE